MNALPSDIANIISRLSHEMNLIDVKQELIEHATIRNYFDGKNMKHISKDRIINQTLIACVNKLNDNPYIQSNLINFMKNVVYREYLRSLPYSSLTENMIEELTDFNKYIYEWV